MLISREEPIQNQTNFFSLLSCLCCNLSEVQTILALMIMYDWTGLKLLGRVFLDRLEWLNTNVAKSSHRNRKGWREAEKVQGVRRRETYYIPENVSFKACQYQSFVYLFSCLFSSSTFQRSKNIKRSRGGWREGNSRVWWSLSRLPLQSPTHHLLSSEFDPVFSRWYSGKGKGWRNLYN